MTKQKTEARLRAHQTRNNLSRQQMAQFLGCSMSAYTKWITGHLEPGPMAERLIDILDQVERHAPDLHRVLLQDALKGADMAVIRAGGQPAPAPSAVPVSAPVATAAESGLPRWLA